MIKIEPSKLSHAFCLGPRLREQDRNEVLASHHLTGEAAVVHSYQNSEFSFSAVEDNGLVAAMWGVSKNKEGPGGVIWFLGSDRVNDFPVLLFRTSRIFVKEALLYYGYLHNYVDMRNTLSIQWLRWLGFYFDDPAPYGVDQMMFHRFHVWRDAWRGTGKRRNELCV